MIDIYVLNTDFQIVGIIDTYESFIWTDRFYSYGDFEIYTAFDINLINMCKQDYYVWIKQSEHVMIIEGIEVESDADDGNKLRITGRSLESIIDRRIVWQQMTIPANTTFQNAIKRLLDDAFLAPHPYKGSYNAGSTTRTRTASQLAMANKRKLKNLVFQASTDEYILGIKVEKTEYTGDNLYDIFQNMFEDTQKTVGYKITLNDQNQFVFQLYTGVDRSYNQQEYVKTEDLTRNTDKTYYIKEGGQYVRWVPATAETDFTPGVTYYEKRGVRPYVVFSPQFDNVINSNYIDNTSDMKNVTLVAGEDSGDSRVTLTVGDAEDLTRRELFTDARDMKSEDYGKRYNEALKTRGMNKLTENSRITSYEGKVEASRQFVYGPEDDFYMGDVIQMANEYGIEGNARVIEWVLSDSSDGIETYPTFDAVTVLDTTITEDTQDVPS